VSWVGNRPANPEATVTAVAAAKENEPVRVTKQVTLDEIEEMVEKIIERKNGKYCLYAKKDRKLLGCHKTRAGAVNQERAIQARRFAKMNASLDEMLKPIRAKKWANINKQLDSILEKAPQRGRSQRGMRSFMTDCRRNALKLRNYDGLQSVRDPEAFCAEMWRNPGKFPGRGPKTTRSRVRDQSGQKLRRALADAGWTPKERLRRGRTPSWNKKR
tara:strand:- start:40 stop:687 length:648 start_codon:yes stop_codon:yes gene_type:complete